jgi:hypothetical protein
VGDDTGGVRLLWSSWVGGLGAWVRVGVRLTWCVDMVIAGSYSSMWVWSVEGYGVRLRLCVLGEGFHALHWKMLSWFVFDCCVRALRFFRCEWIVCAGRGGFMVKVLWFVGGNHRVGWEWGDAGFF